MAIVIPTHNRKEKLERVLIQLREQIVEINWEVIIIIVNDGSSDGTYDMVKNQFPWVHQLMGTGDLWYTRSMNMGFEYAVSKNIDYVLTLNDDVLLGNEYLKQIISGSMRLGENSILGSASYTKQSPNLAEFTGIKRYIGWRQKFVRYHEKYSKINPDEISGIKPSVVLPGRGMLIPVHALLKLGFFDNYFVQYHSDTDFCLRARKNGFEVYISYDAILFSDHTLTSATSSHMKIPFKRFLRSFFNKYSTRYIPHKIKLFYRHGNTLLLPVTITIFFLAHFKAYFFRRKVSTDE